MKPDFTRCLLLLVSFVLLALPASLPAAERQVAADQRCPVCGMFVAKYEEWLTQIEMSDGHMFTFDGVKDMMAFYMNPHKYGAAQNSSVRKVVVRDYYTLDWIDGENAFYVEGGDVLGPMGHELIPFMNRESAENFMADHRGERVILFSDISEALIAKLRKGHMMKGM